MIEQAIAFLLRLPGQKDVTTLAHENGMIGVAVRRGNCLGGAPMLAIVKRDHRHNACVVAVEFLPCQIELSIDPGRSGRPGA